MDCPKCKTKVNITAKESYCSKCGEKFILGDDVSCLLKAMLKQEDKLNP